MVTNGKTVKVNYTLKVDGSVIDSSEGREPIEFTAGNRQMIAGFEKAVMGMQVGEKKSFEVSPEEGYGLETPGALQEVPRSQMPAEISLEVGMTLYARGHDGQHIPATVAEARDDVVVMNFNHPLAGKTLHFDVEVVGIR